MLLKYFTNNWRDFKKKKQAYFILKCQEPIHLPTQFNRHIKKRIKYIPNSLKVIINKKCHILGGRGTAIAETARKRYKWLQFIPSSCHSFYTQKLAILFSSFDIKWFKFLGFIFFKGLPRKPADCMWFGSILHMWNKWLCGRCGRIPLGCIFHSSPRKGRS